MLALAPAVVILLAAVSHRIDVSLAQKEEPADVREFLPAGFPIRLRGGYAELGLEPLRDVPTIACSPAPRTCRATALPLGELAIEIDGDGPTDVVVRRFAYPFWRTEPSLPVTATEALRLVSFTVPAGRHAVRLQHRRPMAELVGWAISGLSLVLFAAGALVSRYTSTRSP